jgi:hypothetical protein
LCFSGVHTDGEQPYFYIIFLSAIANAVKRQIYRQPGAVKTAGPGKEASRLNSRKHSLEAEGKPSQKEPEEKIRRGMYGNQKNRHSGDAGIQ